MTGIILVRLLVNGLLVWLSNMIFPSQVVLGTACISKMWAVIYSAVALSIINMFLLPLAEKVKDKRMVSNLLVNVVGVWLVGRLADNLGMGISSWRVAIVMGLMMTATQKVVARKVTRLIKK